MMKTAPSFSAEIHMAGDFALAGQIVQRYAAERGICVTLAAQSFIYTGGREEGFKIGFINYPRFPVEHENDLLAMAVALGSRLLVELGQHSYSIVTSTETIWFSRRDQEGEQ